MNTPTESPTAVVRWGAALSLLLVTAGAAAQTLGSAEELREALKKELTPLRLSIEEQAKAVAADLAENVLAELASSMSVSAPERKLARRSDAGSTPDAS